jgi:hypothetical protein
MQVSGTWIGAGAAHVVQGDGAATTGATGTTGAGAT